MSEAKRVEIPESAKESLRMLMAQKQQQDQLIQTYIRALQDTLDIKGTGWSLELAEMAFVQQSPNGKADADVVGAVAGDSSGKSDK
jgi:acetone carboxylase gamma subunit